MFGVTFDIFGEPFVEFVVRIEHRRHDEMQEGPQFSHAVLNWSSAEEQSVSTIEAEQHFPSHAEKRDGTGRFRNPNNDDVDFL